LEQQSWPSYRRIDFTALSLAAPEKVHFRYKLEGFDKGWREVINDREARYTNLPPGHFSFRVLAANDGVWNTVGDTLAFSIAPAWWQTLWFRALLGLAAVALLVGAYWLRLRAIRRDQAVERRLQGTAPRAIGRSESGCSWARQDPPRQNLKVVSSRTRGAGPVGSRRCGSGSTSSPSETPTPVRTPGASR
jgi:hypothetical protein